MFTEWTISSRMDGKMAMANKRSETEQSVIVNKCLKLLFEKINNYSEYGMHEAEEA